MKPSPRIALTGFAVALAVTSLAGTQAIAGTIDAQPVPRVTEGPKVAGSGGQQGGKPTVTKTMTATKTVTTTATATVTAPPVTQTVTVTAEPITRTVTVTQIAEPVTQTLTVTETETETAPPVTETVTKTTSTNQSTSDTPTTSSTTTAPLQPPVVPAIAPDPAAVCDNTGAAPDTTSMVNADGYPQARFYDEFVFNFSQWATVIDHFYPGQTDDKGIPLRDFINADNMKGRTLVIQTLNYGSCTWETIQSASPSYTDTTGYWVAIDANQARQVYTKTYRAYIPRNSYLEAIDARGTNTVFTDPASMATRWGRSPQLHFRTIG